MRAPCKCALHISAFTRTKFMVHKQMSICCVRKWYHERNYATSREWHNCTITRYFIQLHTILKCSMKFYWTGNSSDPETMPRKRKFGTRDDMLVSHITFARDKFLDRFFVRFVRDNDDLVNTSLKRPFCERYRFAIEDTWFGKVAASRIYQPGRSVSMTVACDRERLCTGWNFARNLSKIDSQPRSRANQAKMSGM